MPPKYFHITTLGCKVNQYDSQLIREQFTDAGYFELLDGAVPSGPEDMIVINTCTVTGRADLKCRNIINRLIKQKGEAKVVVAGCYAQGDKEALEKIRGVDLVVQNEDKGKILEILRGITTDRSFISRFDGHTRAFLKIQDGCNEFCSYCRVPYVRGRSISKELGEIVSEATQILNNGYKEIVLTGVHIGDYGRGLKKSAGLYEAVKAVSEIPGKFRIRISSIEPMDIGVTLIEKLSRLEKLCPHFHIPLQSGDDDVLKRMKRRYNFADYKKITGAVKKHFHDAAISTDMIVGFPGETQSQFENSLAAVDEIGFSKVHIFHFSRRKGTAAADFKDLIAPKVLKSRVDAMRKCADRTAKDFNKKFIGSTREVIVEEGRDRRLLSGFTENYQKVRFEGDDNLKRSFVSVNLTAVQKDGFLGSLIR